MNFYKNFILRQQNILRNTHRTKTMFTIKTFYFREGKATPRKFTPHPRSGGKFEISNGIFRCLKIKTHSVYIENKKGHFLFLRNTYWLHGEERLKKF